MSLDHDVEVFQFKKLVIIQVSQGISGAIRDATFCSLHSCEHAVATDRSVTPEIGLNNHSNEQISTVQLQSNLSI